MIPALLRDNVGFRRLWAAQTVSLFGDQVSLIAFPLTAVIVLHARPEQMGYLTAAQMAPNLVFALHAGSWVDRVRRHRAVMIAADLARALALCTVPVAYALGELTMIQLYAVGFVIGALSVFFRVATPSLVTSLVDRRDYVAANQWTNGSRAMSHVAGPTVAGLLVEAVSGPVAVILDALSYVGSALFLWRTALPPQEVNTADEHAAGGLGTGMKFIWRDPLLRSSLISSATVNLFGYAVLAVMILYLNRSLHLSPVWIGLLMGGGAVGGVIGSLLAGRASSRFGLGRAYIAGMFLYPLPVLLIPAAAGPRPLVYTMVFAAEFGSGFGVMLLDILGGSLFQAVVPDWLRARFMGAFLFVNYGVRPAGAVLGGLAGVLIGLRATLWLAASGAVLAGFVLLLSPTRNIKELPETAGALASAA